MADRTQPCTSVASQEDHLVNSRKYQESLRLIGDCLEHINQLSQELSTLRGIVNTSSAPSTPRQQPHTLAIPEGLAPLITSAAAAPHMLNLGGMDDHLILTPMRSHYTSSRASTPGSGNSERSGAWTPDSLPHISTPTLRQRVTATTIEQHLKRQVLLDRHIDWAVRQLDSDEESVAATEMPLAAAVPDRGGASAADQEWLAAQLLNATGSMW